ncbi:MAG: protease-4 [Candidatus Deianiraeaceae bacterium]|jgi:protease-4
MFEWLKKGKKDTKKISNSDYNTLAFVEKLLFDVTKWKVIAVASALVALFVLFSGGNSDDIISAKYTKKFIAVIEVDNVIVTDKHRSKILKKLAENKNLKGVLLKINSPGGTITGSEILYNEVKKLSNIVPVYSLIYDVGASGGYMVAIGSTKIFAHETSLTGSIGVLMQSLEASKLAEKIGAKFKTYRSAKYKAQPDTFEETTDDINKYMHSAIMESHKFFENLVRRERNISIIDIKNVANGKIFTGLQAVSLNLIDGVSTEDGVKEALTKALKQKIDFKEVSLKKNEKKNFISELINQIIEGTPSSKVQVMAIMK